MAESTQASRGNHRSGAERRGSEGQGGRPQGGAIKAALIAALIVLAGCTPKIIYVRDTTKSETEIRVEAIKDEWLVRCAGLPKSTPKNEIGNLLSEYNQLAGVSATCIAMQRSLVDYLRPVVEKERKRVPEKDPVTPAKK